MKSKYPDLGLLILRVGISGLMLTHGIPKLQNLISGEIKFGEVFGLPPIVGLIITVIAEVVAPILIIIGLRARIASIAPVIVMAVAAFVIHAADPIDVKEKALLYLFGFLTILLAGPGKYGIDKK
ncbi:DoxX family protein [Spongiivirga sp. MCCC 1A20706]|uniref:DoxX family protein n=1 Tax=Spongiivirga sp. MCCC 1A20706 TaxID=3160963 RepID=UPI003977B87F